MLHLQVHVTLFLLLGGRFFFALFFVRTAGCLGGCGIQEVTGGEDIVLPGRASLSLSHRVILRRERGEGEEGQE